MADTISTIKFVLFGGPTEGLSGCGIKEEPDRKILAPQGMYHGVFANHYTDAEHLMCFEESAGEKADISLRFMNFKEISAGEPFPAAEAKRMKKHGGSLYLVLEPGSGKGKFDRTYSPENIVSGKYDEQLEAFAKGCKKFGGPIFVSFRPPRDSGHSPDSIEAAYIYLYRKLEEEGAKNITWVWNAAPADPDFPSSYPGSGRVDWISVSVYHHEGENPADAIKRLEDNIGKLKKLNKPIMVEFGSSATEHKDDFIKMAVSKFKELGVKAFILNNVSQYEGSDFKAWSLTGSDKAAYAEAISNHERFLRENIITSQGEMKESPWPAKELNCEEIEETYYTAAKASAIAWFKKVIKEKERYLSPLIGPLQKGDPHYNNKERIALARAYLGLFVQTRKAEHRSKAETILNKALQSPDPVLIYHPEKKFVREYVESLLEIANLYIQVDPRESQKYCQIVFAVLKKTEKTKFFNPFQVRKESISGFHYKTLALEAKILEAQGLHSEAEAKYQEIIKWTDKEASRNFITLWWRGEKRDDLKYNSASARISLGFIKLQQGKPKEAIELFKTVLSWEKVGEEEGFMDQAFGALIGIMRAYLQEDHDFAKFKFNAGLPWAKINKYAGFKKALGIEDTDLNSIYIDKWQIILEGLSEVTLPNEELEEELAKIRGIKP